MSDACWQLVFYTAINGNNNEFYVQSIGSLSGDVQKQLIEVTMEVVRISLFAVVICLLSCMLSLF